MEILAFLEWFSRALTEFPRPMCLWVELWWLLYRACPAPSHSPSRFESFLSDFVTCPLQLEIDTVGFSILALDWPASPDLVPAAKLHSFVFILIDYRENTSLYFIQAIFVPSLNGIICETWNFRCLLIQRQKQTSLDRGLVICIFQNFTTRSIRHFVQIMAFFAI